MKVFLRFGMHKEIEVIHKTKHLIDGLVIPAHILAFQAASTASFVCSLPGHEYVVDPMTFMLQSPREGHRKDDGTLRASIGKWSEFLHPALSDLLLNGLSALTAAELPDVGEVCQNLYNFQTGAVGAGHVDPRAKKYLDRYSVTAPTQPRCVLAPYFVFASLRDPWYRLTKDAAAEMKRIASGHEVAPVVVCAVDILDEATINRIATDFGGYTRCYVWLDNFNQAVFRSDQIRLARALVQALRGAGAAVHALYGGFLMMLMQGDGLQAISHGILYTQHKEPGMLPGGGGVPERYYIPKFHDFRSLSQANLILKRHPELAGGTPTATKVMGGDPDKVFLFASKPELLRRHFLEARKAEAKLLESQPMPSIVKELRATRKKYNASVSQLPNPDATVSRGDMKGLDYLEEWAAAFDSEES